MPLYFVMPILWDAKLTQVWNLCKAGRIRVEGSSKFYHSSLYFSINVESRETRLSVLESRDLPLQSSIIRNFRFCFLAVDFSQTIFNNLFWKLIQFIPVVITQLILKLEHSNCRHWLRYLFFNNFGKAYIVPSNISRIFFNRVKWGDSAHLFFAVIRRTVILILKTQILKLFKSLIKSK